MPNPPNRQQAIEWNGYEMRSYLGVPNHGPIDTQLQLHLLHAYAACISYVDAQIGKLLDELQASGQLEKTIVVLLSDHGWHLGEQSAWGKMTNFEIATRVPLLMSVPGAAPARTQTIAELVDLYPTLCGLSGIETPTHLEGESLVDVLRQPGDVVETSALTDYSTIPRQHHGAGSADGSLSPGLCGKVRSGEVVGRELYDHDTDPQETRNLAADSQQSETIKPRKRRLRKQISAVKRLSLQRSASGRINNSLEVQHAARLCSAAYESCCSRIFATCFRGRSRSAVRSRRDQGAASHRNRTSSRVFARKSEPAS